MVIVRRAIAADRAEVERLIVEYHISEGVEPKLERIARTVRQILRKRSMGILLVACERRAIRGVALAAFQPSAELGLTLVVHDFFVEPTSRRMGLGTALAKRLLEEARVRKVEQVDLEILPANARARAFWESIGFRPSGRILYSRRVSRRKNAGTKTSTCGT